jgi:hypothetical protein
MTTLIVFAALVLIGLRVAFPDNFREFTQALRAWWHGSGRRLAGTMFVLFVGLLSAAFLIGLASSR